MLPAFSSNNLSSSNHTKVGTTFGSGVTNLHDRNLIISSGTVTFGTHTFTADQLGELLSKLLLQYPELAI